MNTILNLLAGATLGAFLTSLAEAAYRAHVRRKVRRQLDQLLEKSLAGVGRSLGDAFKKLNEHLATQQNGDGASVSGAPSSERPEEPNRDAWTLPKRR